MKKFIFAIILAAFIPLLAQASETIHTFDALEANTVSTAEIADEAAVKAEIIRAIENCEESLDVSSYGLTANEAYSLFVRAITETPMLFHVDSRIKMAGIQGKDTINAYIFSYRYPKARLSELKAEIAAETEKVLALMEGTTHDWEKALIAHDYIVSNHIYDTNPDNSAAIRNIYDFFTQRKGVCQAYSLAFKHIMDECGIPCFIVTGDSMNHAWNVAKIDGKLYHIDLTWDDPIWDNDDIFGYCSHDFFLKSNEYMLKNDHFDWHPAYECDSDYPSAMWQDNIYSFRFKDGVWYVPQGEKISKFENGAESVIFSADDTPVAVEYFPDFACVELYGKYLIFNSYLSIYAMNTETGTIVPIITGNDHIAAIRLDGDTLKYCIASSRTAADKVVKVCNIRELDLEPKVFSVKNPEYKDGILSCEITLVPDSPLPKAYAACYSAEKELISVKEIPLDSVEVPMPEAPLYKIFLWNGTAPPCNCAVLNID